MNPEVNQTATQPQTLFSGSSSQTTPQSSRTLDPTLVNLAKAIRQTESGGDFNAKGKSGESGAYQFTDPTWNAEASQFGVNVPLEQATPEEQNEVAYKQLAQWKQQHPDWNIGNFASAWNAGQGESNAYLGTFSDGNPSSGTNKYGAKYNVSDYAKSVATAYQTLKNGGQVTADPNNPSSVANTQNTPSSQPSSVGGDILGGLKWLGNTLFPIGKDLYNDVTGQNTGSNGKSAIAQIADAGLSAIPFIPGLDALAPEADAAVEGGKAAIQAGGDLAEGGKAATTGLNAVQDVAKPGLVSRVLGSPITKMAAIGAGAGALGAVGQGGGVTQALQGAGAGALTGGVLGGVGQILSNTLDSLPSSITKGAFKGLTPEAAQYGIENKSVGSIESMLNDTSKSISDKGGQISDILGSEKYQGAGLGDQAAQKTLSQFPNAGFKSTQDIADAIKDVVPLQKDLVDKVVSGEATLAEKNELRSAIDQSVYNKGNDLPKLSADKKVANMFSNYLRSEVQTQALETAPIFSDMSNEYKWKKVLTRMNKTGSSPITLKSVLDAGIGMGLGGGNPLGAALGYGTEKALAEPSMSFLAAKGLNNLSGLVSSPFARGVGTVGAGLVSRSVGQSIGK